VVTVSSTGLSALAAWFELLPQPVAISAKAAAPAIAAAVFRRENFTFTPLWGKLP
jgi:hypothetical protein